MDKVWFHLDLDAFYASVEVLDHPEYAGKPLIVGSLPGSRGVVSTCSYEARKFGVRSAMPINQAYALCPHGVFVVPRMERYSQLSRQVMAELDNFSPVVQQVSVDEAFIDMTGTTGLFGPPEAAARQLKERVKAVTGGLTCSIGIGPNHYLAKLASDYRKPDGLYRVLPDQVLAFMDSLPLKKLHGAGQKTQQRLAELGLETIPQLRDIPLVALQNMLGQATGQFLYNACRGIASRSYGEPAKSHSISTETTFDADTRNFTTLQRTLLDMSHQVFFRLLEEGWRGRTLSLRLRYSDFTTVSIQTTLGHWVSSGEELHHHAQALFYKKWTKAPLRLLGIGMGNLERVDSISQGELFEDAQTRNRRVEEAVLRLKSKFPRQKLDKASLLGKAGRYGV